MWWSHERHESSTYYLCITAQTPRAWSGWSDEGKNASIHTPGHTMMCPAECDDVCVIHCKLCQSLDKRSRNYMEDSSFDFKDDDGPNGQEW